MNTNSIAIAGGGITGLSTALVLGRNKLRITLLEQAKQFSEVGAGIQLAPNAVRRLQSWGVLDRAKLQPCEPEALQIHRAHDGQALGRLRLRGRAGVVYGAPYLTVHRADLHGVLLNAARQVTGVEVRSGVTVQACEPSGNVHWSEAGGEHVQSFDAVINAQGVWSQIRTQSQDGVQPSWTGHVAYRALVPMDALPLPLQKHEVGLWLGPDMHVVHYPVRANTMFNIALMVREPSAQPTQDWAQHCDSALVTQRVEKMHPSLRKLFDSVIGAGAQWRQWALASRPDVASPQELFENRLLHVGDAAHPMLPYLAQGASMGIEDAEMLGIMLGRYSHNVPFAFLQFARERWQRVARVQARARQNSNIFHATGLTAFGRDLAIKFGKDRVIDMPWLYQY